MNRAFAAPLPTLAPPVETVLGELATAGPLMRPAEYAGSLDADRECEHEHLPTDRTRSAACLTAGCFEPALADFVAPPTAPPALPRAA